MYVPGLSLALATILFAMSAASCTGRGPDVVDPASGQQTQAAIIALGGVSGDELGIVREGVGLASSAAYAEANGAPLGRTIDGIQESFERLFLLNRGDGIITVLDLATRRKLAEIGGFPAGQDSGICGMAFSNLSQAWVIAFGTPSVYHVDAVNMKVVGSINLPGLPTSVATAGNQVFVATMQPDGSATVVVFRSNAQGTGFPFENTLRFTSPIVFMAPNGSEDAMVMVAAGNSSRKPSVQWVKLSTMQQTEKELTSDPLTSRVGTNPEFASITRENYLYVALSDHIARVDVRSNRLTTSNWLPGSYQVAQAEYWSDLLYAWGAGESAIARVGSDGSERDPVTVPGTVKAIRFVNATKLQ